MRELRITATITNRESPSFVKYLNDISKIGLVSPEEEVVLAEKIKCGDKIAEERLVRANLRFVVSVAKQYQGQGLTLPDLVNEGNIGLVQAAKRFDDTRGFKFISYAVWWVRQSIMQAITDQAQMIRVPQNKITLKNKIQKTYAALEQELDRIPSAEELAEVMGLQTEEVQATIGLGIAHISLDAPLGGEDENNLLDVMENTNSRSTDDKMNNRESLLKEMTRSLDTLDSRQKEMICLLYGIGVDFPMSMDEIGNRYNLTRERVRQIRDKAIDKLRTNKNANQLKAFL